MAQIQVAPDRSFDPKADARAGAVLGGASIVFSTLCFLILPVFTAAFILALLVGAIGGGMAFHFKAKRTAAVAFVFATTPLCFLYLLDYAPRPLPFRSSYIAFSILGLAIVVALLALASYFRARRVARQVAV